MLLQRLCEPGHKNYFPHPVLRLGGHIKSLPIKRGPDVNQLFGEIDVPPMKTQEFALA
jgi:hypothetical protein